VNCKYTDNKYYGAFITGINDNGTYEVLFPEDGLSLSQVPVTNLKRPIMSGKTSTALDKYRGQRFFDKGTGSPGDEKYFEPGEFIVKSLAPENCFDCLRVDDEDVKQNYIPFLIGYVIERIREYEEE